jgi:predicted metal-dependent phosphoesterase TrpH
MAADLSAAGVPGSYEGAIALAGNPAMVSRTHFARYLVLTGACRDVREVFQRYLVAGKPGYVPHQWAGLADAVQWIVTAGGVAVMAHPGRYRIGALAMHELLGEFRAVGGVALEVATSSHSEADTARFGRLAQEFEFEVSRGSDFHAPDEAEKVELGVAPVLPSGLTPVWHRFVKGA